MYVVTKRIEFCYGHRLLDYDGVCKHPHGHNAVAEIDVRTDQLDSRNMVADFSDIKRLVKGWIDRELDHKMILREDDPLVAPLRQLGEPMFLLESNPTVERIARLIFDTTRELGFLVVAVRVWETPSSFASYSALAFASVCLLTTESAEDAEDSCRSAIYRIAARVEALIRTVDEATRPARHGDMRAMLRGSRRLVDPTALARAAERVWSTTCRFRRAHRPIVSACSS